MLPTKKMENEIKNKEKLVKELHTKLDKLTDIELKEKEERANLLNSDLSDKIEGKITEKVKVAYCDKELKDKTDEITWLKNDISKIRKKIELCDDKIKLYKYIIREQELIIKWLNRGVV